MVSKMNWEVILWTCLTIVVIMGVFGMIMSVISATNMKNAVNLVGKGA